MGKRGSALCAVHELTRVLGLLRKADHLVDVALGEQDRCNARRGFHRSQALVFFVLLQAVV